MTERCLEQLNQHLHHDICGIQDPSLFNDEISGLQAQLSKHVLRSLQYACVFWAVHWLQHIRAAGHQCQVPSGLVGFCDKHLLHWIEVLSLIKSLDAGRQVVSELLAEMNVSFTISLMPC
jgi:hypothetical protein